MTKILYINPVTGNVIVKTISENYHKYFYCYFYFLLII